MLEFQMPDSRDDKFRSMYNLQQQYIEQFPWQAVCENDLIELRWQSEVVDIKDSELVVSLSINFDPLLANKIDPPVIGVNRSFFASIDSSYQ